MQNYSNAIEVRDVSKTYVFLRNRIDKLRYIASGLGLSKSHALENKQALSGISFSVEKGKAIGIIGKNGSGKSTLLQVIAGILKPTTGNVTVRGKVRTILELGGGFNPELTGLENVYFYSRAMGMTEAEVAGLEEGIISFADIGAAINEPVKTYSDGMFLRLAMAVQLSHKPDVLIIDEVIAAGDLFFQQKCHARIKELMEDGCAMVLATHDMNMVEHYCENAIILSYGNAIFHGNSSEAIQTYYNLEEKTDLKQRHENPVQSVLSSTPQQFVGDKPEPVKFEKSAIKYFREGFTPINYVVTDKNFNPKTVFRYGESVLVTYEIETETFHQVPIGSLVLYDSMQRALHGRDTLQYERLPPEYFPFYFNETGIIKIEQEFELKLQPGQYTLSLGFATITPNDLKVIRNVTPQERNELITKQFLINNFIALTILGDPTGLRFHGIAGMNGRCEVQVKRKYDQNWQRYL